MLYEMYPAPSMAEVWRELPEGTDFTKGAKISAAWCCHGKLGSPEFQNANPTDALINLLIWIKTLANKDKQ